MSNKKAKYPEEFLEICNWVDEKVVKEKNILHLELAEKRQSQMLIISIMLLMVFIIIVFRDNLVNIGAISVLVLAMIGLVVYTATANLKIVKKKIDLKNRILEEFAIHIKDGFTYESSGEVSESKYRRSGFNKNYNEFISNCYMAGDRNGKALGISNIEVKQRMTTNEKQMKNIFTGVFAHVDLTNFTLIVQETQEKRFHLKKTNYTCIQKIKTMV